MDSLRKVTHNLRLIALLNPSCSSSRQIHNYVRPVRYLMRKRRVVEHEKFPERKLPQRRSTFKEWNYHAELYAFGKRLGEEFKEPLLMEAFVDPSFVHQERKRQEELGLDPNTITIQFKDNSDLAKSGEELIDKALKGFLKKEFSKLPKEGVEAVVEKLMSNEILGNVSSSLGTKELIQCIDYPPSSEVFARAFKAVVGALEQSSGYDKVDKFVKDFVATQLCGKDLHDFWDIEKPWHMLLDITRPKGKKLEPRLLRETGRNTLLSVFIVGIYDEDKILLGTGVGESADIAQEMAARDVLRNLFGTKTPLGPFEFQSLNFPAQLIPHVRHP